MKNRPNILLFFTDQQRCDTIHALGNERIITPALDAIAEEAVVFDNCITPAPVCVPARYSMYSGLYPAHSGCCNNNPSTGYPGEGFYSEFTKSGYRTCSIGKMHHADSMYGSMGFEKRITQEEIQHPDDDYTKYMMASPYRDVIDYTGVRSEMYYIPQVSQLPAEYHPTQWIGDRCVDFINDLENDRPFFLVSSFIHPHPPFSPPTPWNKMYRTVSEDPYMPEDPDEFAYFMSDRFVCSKIGISRQDLTLLRNYYYSCISFVDYQIQRIVAALKSSGKYEDTIIVFASDHGEMLGDFGTMGKRSMLEGAVHVPLMIRIPGIASQHRSDVCSLVDIAPTLMKCAGISYDSGAYDGLDLFGDNRHEYVFSQYSTGKKGTYMVATEKDRLIYASPEEKYFYFDTFPEDRNRYDPENERIKDLSAVLGTYIKSDICRDGSGSGDVVSGKSKLPYGPKRVDHPYRRDDEYARMPAGYPIDIE